MMSEPANDRKGVPEGFSPKERPDILAQAESAFLGFAAYKNILYKITYIRLNGSFKLLALPNAGLGPFENIGLFCEKFKPNLPNTTGKDVGVGMYTNLVGDKYDYYFGQQVTSLDVIPDGLVGIDTHTKNFAVMMFIANTMHELVGDETGPGDAMQTAGEYIKTVWLPEHRDIAITDENGDCGKVIVDGKIYHTGTFEVYSEEYQAGGAPAMCFYIPLKEESLR